MRRFLAWLFPERCVYCGTRRDAAALDCETRTCVVIGTTDFDPHRWPSAQVTIDRRPS